MSEEEPGTALAVVDGPKPIAVQLGSKLLTEPEISIMRVIAETVIAAGAGMVPDSIKTPAAALAIMMAGHEVGLPPFTSLRHLYTVNGKTEFDTQVKMGLVLAGDETARFIFHRYDREACDVELWRHGRRAFRALYTHEDAVKSGQYAPVKRNKYKPEDWETVEGRRRPKRGARPIGTEEIEGVWQKYERDMLAWSALRRVCNIGAPDLVNRIPRLVQIGQPPAWLEDPEMLAPGDPGEISPEVQAAAAGELPLDDGRSVDIDTGEVLEDEPPPDETETEPGEPDAVLEGLQQTDADRSDVDQSAEPEPPPEEEPPAEPTPADHRAHAQATFKMIRESWPAVNVQTLLVSLFRKYPETRGPNSGLFLDRLGDLNAGPCAHYLDECLRADRAL